MIYSKKPPKSRNKYGARKSPCNQYGKRCKKPHDSISEAKRCNDLMLMERAGVLTYEPQVPYPLVVNKTLIATHIVDFRIWEDGKMYVEDVKGPPTAEWKIKKKLFCVLYPQIPYIVNSVLKKKAAKNGYEANRGKKASKTKDHIVRKVQGSKEKKAKGKPPKV